MITNNILLAIPPLSVKPDVIFTLFGIPITNSILGMMLVNLFILLLIFAIRKNMSIVPSKIQTLFELPFVWFKETVYNSIKDEKKAKKFFPMFFSLFVLFLVANQLSVVPMIMDITANQGGNIVNLFKVPTSDFSLPIALALFIIILFNIMALAISPLKHIGSFIKIVPVFKARSFAELANALLELFLGLLDIISEIAKVVSLSARLFGNVFAGELMIIIITYIASFTNFIIPIPFIVLSIFSGLVQALVFPLLTVQYMAGTLANVEE
ncbi:hypothetical protein CL656_01780 [bacterium]|nr:hypothetical protein [bacterium]|tara:strand:- start:1452 stop:2255 length:804 start_codon:yes stop_codon:yes gene_type:complete